MATEVPAALADAAPRIDEPILRFPRSRVVPRVPVLPLRPGWHQRGKALIDYVLAVLVAIPAIPVVMLAALAVRLTSRGPAFYSQTRVGLRGRLFTIWKIRSMTDKCESTTGALWCVPGDTRITAVGWFLRKSHIDELPQLWNVLCGDMSLVGPRPERPEFVPDLEQALPSYRQRLEVRPGVTGLAQVQLPPDTDLDSVRRKLAHDLYYVRHAGPWLDFVLLFGTAFYAAGVPFRWVSWMFGVPTGETVEQAMRDHVSTEPIVLPRSRKSA